MHGQWLGEIEGEFGGSLRLELEDRGEVFFGHAYLFYDRAHSLPGFRFMIRLPKTPPYATEVETWYLYPDGGVMTPEDRRRGEQDLTNRFGELPMPPRLNVEFSLEGADLTLNWSAADGKAGALQLSRSDIEGSSALVGRADLASWDQFKQWAISQKPRSHIFRGQRFPDKLASTFHRTWRKDLNEWISSDVEKLFGVVAERVTYPLQLGNLAHNAAIWSILQHHGYPTPMLDWTYSPFVAAFFAFQHVEPDQTRSPRIFLFDQAAWNDRYGLRAFIVDAAPPQIVVLESMAVGNPRSSPQQALSTVTNVADVEAFIRSREEEDKRCYLTVCDLPAQDKPRIMRELELMGITYGSLFPGLDGICRDMKDRLFAPPSPQPS